ncbi:Gfo/Idh/MocA family protein [Paenibacillus sp. 1P03SA]|uniref:Gfo/Idh/MocA family protein n=1 Tax=Paenibacillus sp. 1P03SA TaxID=3132294 RepID=UPI0039A32834
MNVLIIGLGYAGTRFSQAFSNLDPAVTGNEPVEIAYVNRSPKTNGYRYFSNIEEALKEFEPSIVVVSVNDEYHIDVIRQLKDYRGFVICEKPLVHPQDDLETVESSLKNISGFALDLVERYSDASLTLKQYVQEHSLRLVRANFYWGKDRINDHRPTSGVISEIIHPLDLVQWVSGENAGAGAERSAGHPLGFLHFRNGRAGQCGDHSQPGGSRRDRLQQLRQHFAQAGSGPSLRLAGEQADFRDDDLRYAGLGYRLFADLGKNEYRRTCHRGS